MKTAIIALLLLAVHSQAEQPKNLIETSAKCRIDGRESSSISRLELKESQKGTLPMFTAEPDESRHGVFVGIESKREGESIAYKLVLTVGGRHMDNVIYRLGSSGSIQSGKPIAYAFSVGKEEYDVNVTITAPDK